MRALGRRRGFVRSGASDTLPFRITGVTPSGVTAGAGATAIDVAGIGFPGTATIYIDGVAQTTVRVSQFLLQCTVASGVVAVPGFKSIKVIDGIGQESNVWQWPVSFPVPSLSTLTPAFGYLGTGATNVSASGTGIYSPGTTAAVDGSSAPFTYGSPTAGTVQVPSSILNVAGDHAVVLSNPTPGGGASSSKLFQTRYKTPAITGLSTTIIPINSGDYLLTVTDSGGNYYDASAWPDGGSEGLVDDVPVATQYLSATQVRLTIPAAVTAVAGVKVIKVRNPTIGGGGGTSAGSNVSVSAPTTTGLSFSSRVRGFDAFTLRVSGTNLVNGDTVYFAGVALATTFVSSTALDAVVTAPLLAVAGLVSVTVRNAGGYETNAQAFTVLDWQFHQIGTTLRGFFYGGSLVDDGSGRASAWNDQYGSGRNLPAVIKPTIYASVASLNGKPAAYFDGSRGDYLEYTAGWVVSGAAGFITKPAYKIFVAASALASAQLSGNATILGEPAPVINVANLPPGTVRVQDVGTVLSTTFNWNAGAAFVTQSRKSGGSIYMRVNRGTETGAAAGSVYSPASVLVGRGRSSTWEFTGYVGAMLFCDSDINHTNTHQVTNILAYDYGAPFGTMGSVVTPGSCSPSGATQFDVPVELTVTCPGGGLVAGDVVNLDGFVLASTVDSSTQIRAMLTAESLYDYGTKGITIGNAGGIGPPLAFVVAQYIPGAGPNLNTLSPNTATRGDDAFDMLCNGSNFTPSAVVYAGATALLTTFISTTQLSARITDVILNTSGVKAITVQDTLGTSGSQNLTVAAWTFASIPEISDWLEGDSVVLSGSNITQATDKLGGTKHAVEANATKQPLIILADPDMGGNDVMDFDGTNDQLVVTSVSIQPTIYTNAAWTTLAVFRADAITGSSPNAYQNNSVVSLDASSYCGIALRTGPLAQAFTNDGAAKVIQLTVAALTTTLAIFRKFGGTGYFSLNGGAESTLAMGGGNMTTQHLSLGSGLGTAFYNGRIGVVATFTNTPSAANLTRIKNTTRLKYGWI